MKSTASSAALLFAGQADQHRRRSHLDERVAPEPPELGDAIPEPNRSPGVSTPVVGSEVPEPQDLPRQVRHEVQVGGPGGEPLRGGLEVGQRWVPRAESGMRGRRRGAGSSPREARQARLAPRRGARRSRRSEDRSRPRSRPRERRERWLPWLWPRSPATTPCSRPRGVLPSAGARSAISPRASSSGEGARPRARRRTRRRCARRPRAAHPPRAPQLGERPLHREQGGLGVPVASIEPLAPGAPNITSRSGFSRTGSQHSAHRSRALRKTGSVS